MTVLEVIQRSTEFLQQKGVDSPRLQIELMLARVLKTPRLKLYLNFDRALTESELSQTREMVKRRAAREPLQHILGSVSFCGIEIKCSSAALIPRPETELLAERGWQFLSTLNSQPVGLKLPVPDSGFPLPSTGRGIEGEGWPRRETLKWPRTSNIPTPHPGPLPVEGRGGQTHGQAAVVPGIPNRTQPQPSTCLDLGTGTGCIAIAVAIHAPDAMVHAVDVSPEALGLARENADTNNVAGRIQFYLGDAFAALPGGTRFDLIVSNPPYIAFNEIATLQPEVRDFDPKVALDGGIDGLAFYRRIAREAGPFLQAGGKLMLECGDGQAEALGKILSDEKWVVDEIVADYSARPRILIARLGD